MIIPRPAMAGVSDGGKSLELIKADKTTWKKLKTIYLEAFPAVERAPFRWIRRRAAQGRADCWAITEKDACQGLAYMVRDGDAAYLYYFAIDAACRGHGLGTRALTALIRRYAGCRFFLALEPLDPAAPNYPQRVQRHAFYQRCGLADYPFTIEEAGVAFAVMGTGGPIHPRDYQRLIDRFMGLRGLFIKMRAYE